MKEKERRIKQHHCTPSRLNFEFPEEARKHLKMQALRLGVSVREFATILEKLASLELQEDIEAAEMAWKQHLSNGSQTISHQEMMKKVGWDAL